MKHMLEDFSNAGGEVLFTGPKKWWYPGSSAGTIGHKILTGQTY